MRFQADLSARQPSRPERAHLTMEPGDKGRDPPSRSARLPPRPVGAGMPGSDPSFPCRDALSGRISLPPFHSLFSWLPAGLLGFVVCPHPRPRRPPLAVGQREGRTGWRAPRGALGLYQRPPLPPRPLPAPPNPLLPLSPLQKKDLPSDPGHFPHV